MAGDHADPTILKDGADYYMAFTSFSSYPGVVIWHSTDLVNWAPLQAALTMPIGVVFAIDLSKHDNRYYVYIPADPGTGWTIFVIWADHIEGPWSDPIDLKIPGCIDPCHVVGEDGKRYLFVNGVRRIRLTNIDNIVTWHTSQDDGKSWQLHPLRMEVSGINHNVFGEFLSLRLGFYAAGEGTAPFKDFTYRAI